MTLFGILTLAALILLIIYITVILIKAAPSTKFKVSRAFVAFLLIGLLIGGFYSFYHHTATGQEILHEYTSRLDDNTAYIVNVYSNSGDILANYNGNIKIDIYGDNYLKFQYNGRDYIYYNCDIEIISEPTK